MKNLAQRLSKLFKDHWPLLLITFLVFIFFWKFFIKGLIPIPGDFVVGVYYPWLDYKWGFVTGVPVKNPILTDVVSFTYPMQTLAIDMLKSGKWPLWNPYILAGTPLLANFQSSPFSPTNFLYFIFEKNTAWGLQIVFQHFLAAICTYLLLRHWKISKIGSVFGSIIYAFGGFNLIWSQWNGHALAAAFIPLIIFFTDVFLLTFDFRYGLGTSIAFALMILSGYPQIALYLALALFILWAIRIGKTNLKIAKTFFLGIFFLIGIGLSAFQTMPGAELLKLSQREVEPHPFEWAFLPFNKVITFIAPNYFGNHATRNYWGPQDYTSNTGFIGIVAVILIGFSFSLIKKKEVFIGFALLLTSLIFAFPTPVSIYLWKSGFLGFNAASAHRSLVLFNLSAAILSGFGLDYLINVKNPKKLFQAFIIPLILLLIFTVLAFNAKGTTYAGTPPKVVALRNLVIPWSVLILSWGVASLFKFKQLKKLGIFGLFTLVVFEIFNFGWKFTPFSERGLIFPKTPVLDFLMSQEKPFRVTGDKVIPINMRMPYKLESLEGYDAVYPLTISKLIAAINTSHSGTRPLGRYGTVDNEFSNLLPIANVKYTIALKKDEKGSPDPKGEISSFFDPKIFKKVFEDKTTVILENTTALPRAIAFFDWDIISDENEALTKLVSEDYPRERKVILSEDPGIVKSHTVGKAAFLKYVKYEENESVIKVNFPKDCVLFVSDTFFPGWKAYIDGKETKIYRGDYTFRAVSVPEGDHEIRFLYHPESFFGGLKISAISLLFFVLFLGYTSREYFKKDVKS